MKAVLIVDSDAIRRALHDPEQFVESLHRALQTVRPPEAFATGMLAAKVVWRGQLKENPTLSMKIDGLNAELTDTDAS